MAVPFSTRTSWDLERSSLSEAIEESRAAGRDLVDLSVSNPTACGLLWDPDALLDPLRNASATRYEPEPTGIREAREAVAGYYARHNAGLTADQIVLTTSTSEAYSFLFRLLCDPGDEVLVAQPGYPLLDFLATLDNVRLRTYPLFYDFGWWIDFAELESRITVRTRAILLVHPNNPTGHATPKEERRLLEQLCARHDLALIVDEVFLDYSLGEPIQSFAANEHPCLTLVLSGLSKIAALPQMKVGWIVVCGPEVTALRARERLEVIADTFLSMNAPVQLALPHWLASCSRIQEQILARMRINLAAVAASPIIELVPLGAGWSAVLQIPQYAARKDLAEQMVLEAGVIVHPASFYSMAGAHRIVISLLPEPDRFAEGVRRLQRWCESRRLPLPEIDQVPI